MDNHITTEKTIKGLKTFIIMDGFKSIVGLRFKKEIIKVHIFKVTLLTDLIDSFFCRINIKVLFLDENKEVFDIQILKTWRTMRIPKKTKWFIECSPREDFVKGDVIHWEK